MSPTTTASASTISVGSDVNVAKTDLEYFDDTFQTILDDISTLNGDHEGKFKNELKEATEYIHRCMKYNVPHGKKFRGRMVVMVYKSLVPNASDEQLNLVQILGWCTEALQAAYLVADDIMDNAETRRGKKCWYLELESGNNALNDSFLLEHLAYQILRKHFGHLSCYKDLLDLLLRVTYKTVVGQGMDIRASTLGHFCQYNEQLYNAIVTYKTGYYTVYLPAALGMAYAGIENNAKNQDVWQKMKEVTLEIGRYFQIQDDYLDCFGDEKVIGKKVGTDIEEGKCTWLFVKALQICSEKQAKLLKGNYGSVDEDKVRLVKQLYQKLELPKIFAEYQETVHSNILAMIKELHHENLEAVLTMFLKMLHKRVY